MQWNLTTPSRNGWFVYIVMSGQGRVPPGPTPALEKGGAVKMLHHHLNSQGRKNIVRDYVGSQDHSDFEWDVFRCGANVKKRQIKTSTNGKEDE